jgi:endonuclease/exonuclease/phosphatase family metal-dependent hydrolase
MREGTLGSVETKLISRRGETPASQRTRWFKECSVEPGNMLALQVNQNTDLSILSFNMFYGSVYTRNGNSKRNAIDINEYEILFRKKIDIICLQEVVLGPLPAHQRKEGNTTESYMRRDKDGSTYWKTWTRKFKETNFQNSFKMLMNIATKHGYVAYPCATVPGSMYQQQFGNAIFVKVGIKVLKTKCINATIPWLSQYEPKETENRSAILIDVLTKSGKKITVVNTHFSEKPSVRKTTGVSSHEAMANTICKAVGKRSNVILVGDFNKSDPASVPPLLKKHYIMMYNDKVDGIMYDTLRGGGFVTLPNIFGSAWNARQPDQVCVKGIGIDTPEKLLSKVQQVFPWNGKYVISDHSAFLMYVP